MEGVRLEFSDMCQVTTGGKRNTFPGNSLKIRREVGLPALCRLRLNLF